MVTYALNTSGRIVDIRAVERRAAPSRKGSRDSREGGLRIAGCRITNVFVTAPVVYLATNVAAVLSEIVAEAIRRGPKPAASR
jgi:hypothetical protein